MPNTYTQLYIQIVFAVKGRKSLINESFREKVEKYITGIINEKGHKPLAIYCMPDHTHILIGKTRVKFIKLGRRYQNRFK